MTPRELAALIRKGAALRPQHFGVNDRDVVSGRSCVLGAAEEALTGIYPPVGCPSSGFVEELNKTMPPPFVENLWKRNDMGESRESIATWLESLDVSKPKDAQTFDDFMKATLQAVELEQPVTSQIDSQAK